VFSQGGQPPPTCPSVDSGLLNVFACVFVGLVAFSIVCLSVFNTEAERILTKFSQKVSNDKICNCTVIPCSLLIGYYLANI